MPATGLTKSVVDVFLSTLNQVPGDRSGPVGRLTQMVNCQVRHYAGLGQENQRVVVEPREAFQQLTGISHDASTGDSLSLDWSDPKLLSAIGNQLVSVSGQIPRVYNGPNDGWAGYPNSRVIAERLQEDIFHTSDHTIQAPSGAQLGDVTGSVWTESVYDDAGKPITSSWFGIKSNNGSWVLQPQELYAPNSINIRCQAKLVSDGTNLWVFWNDEAAGFRLNIAAYTSAGHLLNQTTITQRWQDTPGYWDVTLQGTAVLLAQPASYNPPNNVGVEFSRISLSGHSIVVAQNTDATVHCQGPLTWITNDADTAHAYLATVGAGSGAGLLWAYQVDPTSLAQTRQYSTPVNFSFLPDSIAGWTVQNGAAFDLNLCYSELSSSAQSQGPVYDPALRSTATVFVPASGSPAQLKVLQSVILVSKAFALDGFYYAYTYYQSGAGLTLTKTVLSVTITPGDFMIGNGTQPIPVQPGDYTTGNGVTGSASTFVVKTTTLGSTAITGADTVAFYTVTGSDVLATGPGALPVGTIVLQWNLSGAATGYGLSNLVVAGSSISGANGTFLIFPTAGGGPSGTVYTQLTSTAGTTPVPGTFTATGTFQVTANAIYPISGLASQIDPTVAFMYPGGQLTISGASGTGNNGTFTGSAAMVQNTNPNEADWYSTAVGPAIRAVATTQTTSPSVGFSYTYLPQGPTAWFFSQFDSNLADTTNDLTVSGTGANDGSFEITSASGHFLVTSGGDASGTVAQVFTAPVPSVAIQVPLTNTPYTFFLQSVTFDYSFFNALIQVKSAQNPGNDGVYQITFLDPTSPHTAVVVPTNGQTDQVNEAFSTGPGTTIVIQKPNGQGNEIQPVWFLSPLDGTQATAGCFERGLAYADWRFEGETGYFGPNVFPLSLSQPFLNGSAWSIVLPYRAKSFTAGQQESTPQGTSTSLVTEALEATVGLKLFSLGLPGAATAAFRELVYPGPLGGGFTSSGWHEQGVNLGPEAPWLVSESNDTTVFGVTSGSIELQVVYEWTDENGERGYSYPSPALNFTLQSPSNTYVLGGRLPLPLDGSGNLIAGASGISNRQHLTIAIYRTATINGIPTTQLYKVTNDLNPNGTYSGSGAGSGFTFPDTYTWHYRDQSLDTAIIDQESLYTSKGQLPRFPAPPNSGGDVWENRTWLAGYDGNVYCSGDKQPGDGNWFFPALSLSLGGDQAVAVARMEQYLVIGGAERMWYIPAQQFPDNTGTGGNLPTPSPLPFPNGCAGPMLTTNSGVFYASTAGGVWLITRDLKNLWVSEPIKDLLQGQTILGLAVDQLQRVAITTGSGVMYVYDPVPAVWYTWALPSNAAQLTSWQGQLTYQDTVSVLPQVAGQYLDQSSAGPSGIAPDLTMAGLTFAQVRAVKRVWELQLVGEYLGPHNLNAVLSYPDDYSADPTSFGPYTPGSSQPYLLAINPDNEEAALYQLRVYADFNGIATPGASFSLELISAEVGIDRRQGGYKLPTQQRIQAN
jgi:hypothetical protein